MATWACPPDIETTVTAAGVSTTTVEYKVWSLVGLSVLVGSAGSSFLTSFQARALALVKDAEATQTRETATQQLQEIKNEAQTMPANETLVARIEQAQAAVKPPATPAAVEV